MSSSEQFTTPVDSDINRGGSRVEPAWSPRPSEPPSSNMEEGPIARITDLLGAVAFRIRRQPLTAMAVATGGGFVLGGALSFRVGRAMLVAAGRHVGRQLLKQLL